MNILSGKVVVVTGAGKGIGKGIALEMARAGASVVINYSSDVESANRVVEEIIKSKGEAVAIQADVSKIEDVQKLFAITHKTFGKLDILVNNAGVYNFSPIDQITLEDFNRQYHINVWGVISTTQEALKYFGAKGGSIINIGGIISTNPYANAGVYAGTKAALDAMTVSFARELAERNIRVNTIAPGATLTDAALNLEGEKKEMVDKIISDTPMKRLGKIEEIGRVAVFLASDNSGWITGESIRAGGGLR